MDISQKYAFQTLYRSRFAISFGFATQGFAYATVMTALPSFKSHFLLNDDELSFIILGVCIAAALGSVLADRLAVKIGSRFAIVIGFILEACGVVFAAMSHLTLMMILSFVIYGIGLGCIDAALNMQAVILEKKMNQSILGSFFACYTAAAFLGALLMSAAVSTILGATGALMVATLFTLIAAQIGYRWLIAGREQAAISNKSKVQLPMKNLVIYGFIIMIAFAVDSAVSTWSSIYLKDVLHASIVLAPIGYAAYQIGILITRLVTDRIIKLKSATWLAVASIIIGAIGCILAGSGISIVAVIIGFALSGVAVGALVPITFSAAGHLDEARRDEIIARVNIFNYIGAIAGAVLVGLLSGPIGYGPSFVAIGVCLILVLFFRRKF